MQIHIRRFDLHHIHKWYVYLLFLVRLLFAGRNNAVHRNLGSTGKPKGVRICHRGLVNQFQYIMKQPGMTSRDRILGVSTISFDIAQLELILPLTCGAQIVLVSSNTAR